MTWVKVCGTTSLEDARLAVEAGADAVGFVFASSPRRIEPEIAREIITQLPATVETVGVFVNESEEHIFEVAENAGLSAVQLHGDEDVDFARRLATGSKCHRPLRVIKAIPVRGGFGPRVLAFTEHTGVEAVLLDSPSPLRGGSGQTFDWRAVAQFMASHASNWRIIIAGGLNASNVAEPLRMIHPWGLDVVSGVERVPGKKDPEKLKAFVAAVRANEET